MAKLTPFFDRSIKISPKLVSETLGETNERLEQLEKDVQWLRDGLQKTQSEHTSLRNYTNNNLKTIDANFKTLDEYNYFSDKRISKLKPAITAAKPKPRSRTKPKAKRRGNARQR